MFFARSGLSSNGRLSRSLPVDNGFTFLEVIVSMVCLGIILCALTGRFGSIADESAIIIAIEEMRQITQAVRDGFYADLGVIPADCGQDGKFASLDCPGCGDDDRPWFATRYLCLCNDGDGNFEYEEMVNFLQQLRDKDTAACLLEWDRYLKKGWRGPYMAQEIRVAVHSHNTYPFPLISSPWAEKCEEMALEAEDSGNADEAAELRKGKYYLVVADRDEQMNPLNNTARIISFGSDCHDSGAYHTDYYQTNPEIPTTAEDLRKLQGSDTDSLYVYDTGDDIVVFIFGAGPTRKP